MCNDAADGAACCCANTSEALLNSCRPCLLPVLLLLAQVVVSECGLISSQTGHKREWHNSSRDLSGCGLCGWGGVVVWQMIENTVMVAGNVNALGLTPGGENNTVV